MTLAGSGLIALLLSGCELAPVPAAPATLAVAAAVPVAAATGFAGLLNAQRASGGLPPATADARLTAAAQAHAQDMASRDYFSHRSPEGTSVADRVRAAGYSPCRSSENIAFGQTSEAAAFQSWATSPPHLANIMMRGPVQFGLGHAGNKWVLVVAGVC